MTTKWTATVSEDPDTKEMILSFPDSMIIDLKWSIGDILSWEIALDNSILLTNTSLVTDKHNF